MNACVHTYTKPQTSSTRSRGPGWRIHGSVEDTKLSTNKQHTLFQDDSSSSTVQSAYAFVCACKQRMKERERKKDRESKRERERARESEREREERERRERERECARAREPYTLQETATDRSLLTLIGLF